MDNILDIKDLQVTFLTEDGRMTAVDGIDVQIGRGQTIGLVGESGCGKSVTSLAIMGLIPNPPGKVTRGQILFNGEDLVSKSQSAMCKIRGNHISMIFQEPMTSLNPVFTVGEQIAEALELHCGMNKSEAVQGAIEQMRIVGIPAPEKRAHEYPHQMSGGMRQRVMIAMALACRPDILIADEPTTALDVTIQAQILDLMRNLRKEINSSIILITHDLGVVAEMVDEVYVMYAGKIVEHSLVEPIFVDPLHPYTRGLLESIPKVNEEKERLHAIEGMVPNPFFLPEGCAFHPRCSETMEICRCKQPDLYKKGDRSVRCWKYAPGAEEKGVDSLVSH